MSSEQHVDTQALVERVESLQVQLVALEQRLNSVEKAVFEAEEAIEALRVDP